MSVMSDSDVSDVRAREVLPMADICRPTIGLAQHDEAWRSSLAPTENLISLAPP